MTTEALASYPTLSLLNNLLSVTECPLEREALSRIKARNYLEGYAEYIQLEDTPAEHHRLVCRALDDIVRHGNQNIMIFQPPGTAKSTYANILFSSYYLGHHPDHRVINCSYNYDLAKDFGRKTRNLVNTPTYDTVFSSGLAPDTRAVGEWEVIEKLRKEHQQYFLDGEFDDDAEFKNYGFDNRRRGGYVAAGVGTGLTGRRGNIGIIDDPVKDAEEADSPNRQRKTWDWYTSVFSTRLLPNYSQIIIQTRWNENDLCGKILPKDWSGESGVVTGQDGDQWTVICMPAVIETEKQAATDPLKRKIGDVIWPEYFTPDYWRRAKNRLHANPVSKRHWSALYQQQPKPDEGVYFKREWFPMYEPHEIPHKLNKYKHSDFAVTDEKDNPDADYTEEYISGVDEDKDLWMLLDGYHGQLASDKWVKKSVALSKKHRPLAEFHEGGVIRKAIEPFYESLRAEEKVYTQLNWLNPIGDKKARLRTFQMYAGAGRVRLPNNKMGNRLLEHLIAFPNSTMDHGPDACSCLMRGLLEIDAVSVEEALTKEERRDYGFKKSYFSDEYDDDDGDYMVA